MIFQTCFCCDVRHLAHPLLYHIMNALTSHGLAIALSLGFVLIWKRFRILVDMNRGHSEYTKNQKDCLDRITNQQHNNWIVIYDRLIKWLSLKLLQLSQPKDGLARRAGCWLDTFNEGEEQQERPIRRYCKLWPYRSIYHHEDCGTVNKHSYVHEPTFFKASNYVRVAVSRLPLYLHYGQLTQVPVTCLCTIGGAMIDSVWKISHRFDY